MSRHLIIRCDAPGCEAQTITGASDTEPTAIGVPDGWLTLITPGRPHRHYCSETCLRAAAAPPAPVVIHDAITRESAANAIDALTYPSAAAARPARKRGVS